eukprot:640111-Prymnesium_polylepis.2
MIAFGSTKHTELGCQSCFFVAVASLHGPSSSDRGGKPRPRRRLPMQQQSSSHPSTPTPRAVCSAISSHGRSISRRTSQPSQPSPRSPILRSIASACAWTCLHSLALTPMASHVASATVRSSPPSNRHAIVA